MSAVVAAGLLLAGCGGIPAPTPGASTGSPSPSPSVTATATPTATASPTAETPAVVAGFELSGDALISVDAGGIPIATYPFTDRAALIGALTAFHGTPYSGAATPDCEVEVTVWPDEFGPLVVVYTPSTGDLHVVVKEGGFSVQPSEGPGFGEDATAFIASLPAASVGEIAYVYDPVGVAADDRNIGGVAFVDGSNRVDSLASPTVAAPGEFC